MPVLSQEGLLTQSASVTRAGRFSEYSQFGFVIQPDKYSLGGILLSRPECIMFKICKTAWEIIILHRYIF